MEDLYIKDGVVKRKNQICLEEGERIIFNPNPEKLIEHGWSVWKCPASPAPEISKEVLYKERIVELLRERYSTDDEMAILRQRDRKPDEFAEYDAYAEECKIRAREEVYNEHSEL